MKELIPIIYTSTQGLSLLMSWPQLKRLYKTKQSKELSLKTWAMWTLSSCVTTLYSFSTGQYLWMTFNVFWIGFYIAMVAMIVRYRQNVLREQVINFLQVKLRVSLETEPVHLSDQVGKLAKSIDKGLTKLKTRDATNSR